MNRLSVAGDLAAFVRWCQLRPKAGGCEARKARTLFCTGAQKRVRWSLQLLVCGCLSDSLLGLVRDDKAELVAVFLDSDGIPGLDVAF